MSRPPLTTEELLRLARAALAGEWLVQRDDLEMTILTLQIGPLVAAFHYDRSRQQSQMVIAPGQAKAGPIPDAAIEPPLFFTYTFDPSAALSMAQSWLDALNDAVSEALGSRWTPTTLDMPAPRTSGRQN